LYPRALGGYSREGAMTRVNAAQHNRGGDGVRATGRATLAQ
jgi:hypothetical protein